MSAALARTRPFAPTRWGLGDTVRGLALEMPGALGAGRGEASGLGAPPRGANLADLERGAHPRVT